ncbi:MULTISPECIES: replication initiation protein RepM [Acinetobacter]|jgi:plasmid replication initiation protein|uniref:replication initiation protein RepM n=1 Tax=Acinetobacter TaxID=469 RepID=UPI001038B538|nr:MULTISPECIES: replication initiation protein RepM [Acinetobacter]MCA4791128.1 replication initiation protein [Acinetobacter towneri]MCA4799516.1 replication initiation protein [Acinetobacter towneri]MCO8083696.1 replication initiation protein RepM [Acinetobacter lwoffii]MDH2565489.1 replication initiation protein RepM [Acinetobacter baumannii]TCB12270.1 RepB family plasmid replication initiator protein [Acinetobacter sp. ANC 5045]
MRDLVVKDNALINASYNLDLVEQRLILLAIVEARESGKGINANNPLEVHAESYINQFNVARQTAYQALKDASKDLFARQFSYQEMNKRGNIENVLSRWVSEIRYVDAEATVKLIFAPAIVPLITKLEEQFTKYELQQVSNLSSAYAVRLYELLIAWRSTGQTPVIELEEFRKKIGVLDDEYTRMGNFKDRVLHLAMAQVNEFTDITVKYEQHKKGRSIYGFSFSFKQKKNVNKPNLEARDQNTLDIFTKLTDAQRHLFANKLSELPEMSKYSQGTESYPQFAVRIAEMLLDAEKFKELYPYLVKVGFQTK